MNYFNHTSRRKKLMSIAGLIWLLYLFFHLFTVLNFHLGKASFNQFYDWFTQTPLYWILLVILIITLCFHVITAISRQLSNNISATNNYKKTYPKIIPKIVVWTSVGILFLFIIFHIVQMTLLINKADLYQSITLMFSNPIIWIIYALGLLTLSAHLYHSLTNVLQTLGISSKPCHATTLSIMLFIVIGFISIPISINL